MADYSLEKLYSPRGKRVVVTGGGTGLGRFLAEGLSAQGARVWIVGRRQEKLQEVKEATKGKGTEITTIVGDINSKEGITKIVEEYKKSGENQLDVLINCAGILRTVPQTPHDADKLVDELWDDKWENWQDSFNTNVTALYFTSVAFIPLLRRDSKPSASEGGVSPQIINITSIAGLHHGRYLPTSYQASKAAAHHLTAVLSSRLLPFRIRVNSIAPGIFPSEMTLNTPIVEEEKVKRGVPEGRTGLGEDIVGTVGYVIGRAGGYLNGESIVVDGGRLLTASSLLGGDL